ncbi:MAG TPA: diguanylate cyclase [Thermoanaerobaculia bacterium]
MRFHRLVVLALASALPAYAEPDLFEGSPPVVHPGPPALRSSGRWLSFRVFTYREGLVPHPVGLTLDQRGYIWGVTQNGIVQYNGKTWRKINSPRQAASTSLGAILAARDGSLWVGGNSGLSRLRRGKWKSFDRRLWGENVGTLAETFDKVRSTIWAGVSLGLLRCVEETCTPEKTLHGISVRAILPTRTKEGRPALWLGTDRGLLRLDGIDTPAPSLSPLFEDTNVLPDQSIRSLAETVTPGQGRSLWVGTDRGLALWRNGTWLRYDEASGFPTGSVAAIRPSRSPDGRSIVWAGLFRSGLVRFEEDGRWTLFDASSGLPSNYIYSLFITDADTADPTLWVAAAGSGLARLERERWYVIDSRAGLPHDSPTGLGEATFPDGFRGFWVGTIGGTVRLTRRGWERFLPFPSAPPAVFDIATTWEADAPVFWMATTEGLLRFGEGRWTTINSGNSPLPFNMITRLLATPRGRSTTLWVGTPHGLARYERGDWTVYRSPISGLPDKEIWALLDIPSRDGTFSLWAGTDSGVAKLEDGRWLTERMSCLPNAAILSLHATTAPGGAHWLWIGTRRGLARVQLQNGRRVPESCQILTDKTRPALPNATIWRILSDVQNRIYVNTEWGVARVTLDPSQDLGSAAVEAFGTEDGLPSLSFTRAAFRDHFGRIWTSSAGGAAILDPADEPRNPAPAGKRKAPLVLEGIRIVGQERPLPSGAVLPHDENSLEIEYALLSYRREHRIRYRTQLAGLDDKPSQWSHETRVVYDRLPQGRYTFRLWGKDSDGVVSGPLELSFWIRPAPWRTSWALALYVFALLGLGYSANRMHLRTLARRAAELETQVAVRTRELAEANLKLELASLTDPLTGLYNRRFVALNLQPDLWKAERNYHGPERRETDRDLLFYFLDIDHFKQLNDRAGHAAGDAVLIELAHRLREIVRESDLVVRWGGEELLIVSRWTDRASGEALASRILAAVSGTPFVVGEGQALTITCSIGWAPYPWYPEDPECLSFEQVLSLADRALYLAKKAGRNRAVGALPGSDGEKEEVLKDVSIEELEDGPIELVRTGWLC